MDPIDVLTLAIIVWCGQDQKPLKYTQESIGKCADAIYECAIDDKGKVLTKDEDLVKCSEKGKKLLVKYKPNLP